MLLARQIRERIAALLLFLLLSLMCRGSELRPDVEDIFGRRLESNRVVLVDWEGYMANPAIKIFVRPPTNAVFPATAILSANGARLYLDLPSEVSGHGPSKFISFASATERIPVRIAIFPDRDNQDEDYELTVSFRDSNAHIGKTRMPIHVIDQDKHLTNSFTVNLDFSQDETGFFLDPLKCAIARQAADDWAYFIGDLNLQPTLAGTEKTRIWSKEGFRSSRMVTNRQPYTGFLLYAYGIHSRELRSGGEGSHEGGFQKTNDGREIPLRRSGGYEAEIAGNYNSRGWLLLERDEDWWVTSNLGHETNDLYSIAHHEIGHALFFNPAYPLFASAKKLGMISDMRVVAYQKSAPTVDRSDHFPGVIDRASGVGAFGNDYHGVMPPRRWLITKLDLLCLQSIGYPLRATTAFAKLAFDEPERMRGRVGEEFSKRLSATGGIPFYCWSIVKGTLPPGLFLDSFTGELKGTPTMAGEFSFEVNVRDYEEGNPGVSQNVAIEIRRKP